MAQESVAQDISAGSHGDGHVVDKKSLLGPLLCWAVVFADIGTSVYYVPGILFKSVGGLAGFFVLLTMSVFILLTIKYAEVTHRFPQGGGVVTVAAQALNPWFGALGGMFILVDYFLTAAISCLSGVIYLGVVFPALHPFQLWITIGVLALLGLLNWVGISESAKVSFVFAIIAFLSTLAVVVTVLINVPFAVILDLFPRMFSNASLMNPEALLAGFAGSFLAFSGLESISQLSPVMKHPHKKIAGQALFLVVVTIGITSPLLTMFTTMLLSPEIMQFESDSSISLLAGNWGNTALQIEVAISASLLLVFASNTAIIGAYHVFLALSRMDFMPPALLKRNKLRGTPHVAIFVATAIPIAVLLIVWGNITILGDMYAFGLLGAFSLTCLGLDIVRGRDWFKARRHATITARTQTPEGPEETLALSDYPVGNQTVEQHAHVQLAGTDQTRSIWFKISFFLGILTTILVMVAWGTNLFTKHLATVFGGAVTLAGMGIALLNYLYRQKQGKLPVPAVSHRLDERIPNAVLAVLTSANGQNNAVIKATVNHAEADQPVVFLYIGEAKARAKAPRMMEIVDPYLEDPQAKEYFSKAASLIQRSKIPNKQARYIYLQGGPNLLSQVWQLLHPRDTVIAAKATEQMPNINPDRVRYELTADGKVAHLLKRW
jgi:amino acid transporter